ncbi:hypothetical protein [Shewanella algae]|uniref:hypothetical protein n=1 Tax=Shewanella algae TaxID=38313 RepID=UPI001C57D94F|nr:hypothetical protein [Shewanella algae]HDS1196768.1 hypothetical protein [Shewanella algae]
MAVAAAFFVAVAEAFFVAVAVWGFGSRRESYRDCVVKGKVVSYVYLKNLALSMGMMVKAIFCMFRPW